jgi:hypothetical protein
MADNATARVFGMRHSFSPSTSIPQKDPQEFFDWNPVSPPAKIPLRHSPNSGIDDPDKDIDTSTVPLEEKPSRRIIPDAALKRQENINRLKDIYYVENDKKIEMFLLANDYLIEILFEAPEKILKIFGEVRISLELHKDPEEGWDELFIIIKSNYEPEEAVRRKEQLTEEWFIDRMDDTKGKLNFTEEPL